MFTSFLFERLTHYRQFYSTEAEFIQHLMSGEVKIPIPDLIQFQSEYEKNRAPERSNGHVLYPSRFELNQVVQLKINEEAVLATVRGIHFYPGKIKYDLGLWLGDGTVDDPEFESRIYNVDSILVHLPDPAIV